MDFAALQSALRTWVLALLGWAAPADVVVFENEARPLHNGRIAVLAWIADAPVGPSEVRYEDSGVAAPAPDMVPVVIGATVLTLQIGLETNDQTAGVNARALAQTLRARLWRPSSLAALDAANVGLVDAGPVRQADYRDPTSKRFVARAVVDVRLNASSFDRDAIGSAPSIASAEVTSHVESAGGTELPASLQMNAEEIP